MKTLKKSVLAVSFLLIGFLATAGTPDRPITNASDALNHYVETITQGQIAELDELLGVDFKQYIDCDNKTSNFDKKQFMRQMKYGKDYVMNCTSDVSIVEEKKDFVIAKVVLEYPRFTKTDYVTMNYTPEGWKVTSVSVHYN
jgi:hypothetical protein